MRSTLRGILMTAMIAIMIAASWLGPLDQPAMEQIDAGLKRALISFATARALNGAISVAQGTEISAQPLGVGVNFAPGQILDPVNDLVEQLSNLMLAASIAFGVQKLLVGIGAFWVISLALSMLALGWLGAGLARGKAPGWLQRALLVLVLVRFAVPVVALGGEVLFQRFLAPDYASSQQVIESASGQASRLSSDIPSAATPGLVEQVKGWWAQGSDAMASFSEFKRAAEVATEHVVRLGAIFVLQTLVLPLLLLWALYAVTKGALVRDGR
jgi:hypothetical protein